MRRRRPGPGRSICRPGDGDGASPGVTFIARCWPPRRPRPPRARSDRPTLGASSSELILMDETREISAVEVLSKGYLGPFVVRVAASGSPSPARCPLCSPLRCASCSGAPARDLAASFLIREVNYAVGSKLRSALGVHYSRQIDIRAGRTASPSNCHVDGAA